MLANFVRDIFWTIDVKVIYPLLSTIFQLIIDLSNYQLFTNDTIKSFSNRIYLILGIVMVFKLMISFIQMLIDPDRMNDKENGFGGILKRVTISMILIVIVPEIFTSALKLQEFILPVIPKIILASPLDTDGNVFNSVGQKMAYQTFVTFFHPFPGCEGQSHLLITGTEQNATISSIGDITNAEVKLKGCSSNSDNGYVYEYQIFVSTIVGAFLIYVLVTVALKIAIRAIKFSLCRIIAPIPIASYIDPKTSKQSFDKWVETSVKVYLDLFTRLAVVYFIVYVFRLLFVDTDSNGLTNFQRLLGNTYTGEGGTIRGLLVMVFIILGLLYFAKEMPKFMSNMLGIKDGFTDIGDMFKGQGWGALGGALGTVKNTASAGLSAYNYSNKFKGESKGTALRRAAGAVLASGGRSISSVAGGKGYKGTLSARDTTLQNVRRTVNTAKLREEDRARYEEDVRNNGGSIRGVTPAAGSFRGYVQDAWHEFSGTPLPSSDSYSQAASLMNSGKSNIFNQAKTKVSERPDMIKDSIELKDADGNTVTLTQNIYDANGNVTGTRVLRDSNGNAITSAKFSDVYDAYKAMQEGRKVTTRGFENMNRSQLEAIYGNVWKDAAAKYVNEVATGRRSDGTASQIENKSMANAIEQWKMRYNNETIITADDKRKIDDDINRKGYGGFFKSSDDKGAEFETKAMRLKATEEAKKGDKS